MPKIFERRATSPKEYAEEMRQHLDEIAFLKTSDTDAPVTQNWVFEHKDGRVAHLQDRCPYAEIYKRAEKINKEILEQLKTKKLIKMETLRTIVYDEKDKNINEVNVMNNIVTLLAKRLEDMLDRHIIIRVTSKLGNSVDFNMETADLAAKIFSTTDSGRMEIIALAKPDADPAAAEYGFSKVEETLSVFNWENYHFAFISKEKKESHE